MVSTVDVLRVARDLYAQAPSHAPDGASVEQGCYCPLTALLEASGYGAPFDHAEVALRQETGFASSIVVWNATHSTKEVLAAFDRAIEAEALKVAD